MVLHSTQGPLPSERHVPLVAQGDLPTPLDLQDALPLDDFLAPLGDCKEAICTAVEELQGWGEATRGRDGHRGFGPALQVGNDTISVVWLWETRFGLENEPSGRWRKDMKK